MALYNITLFLVSLHKVFTIDVMPELKKNVRYMYADMYILYIRYFRCAISQVQVHRWYTFLTSIHAADGQLLTDDR